MKKSEENKIQKVIVIEGISLTEAAIAEIASLQEHDNYMLKDTTRVLADFICLILQNRGSFVDDVQSKLDDLLGDLASIRNSLDDLRKP